MKDIVIVIVLFMIMFGVTLTGTMRYYGEKVDALKGEIADLKTSQEKFARSLSVLMINCSACHGDVRANHLYVNRTTCEKCHPIKGMEIHGPHAKVVPCRDCHGEVPTAIPSCQKCHTNNLIEIHLRKGCLTCHRAPHEYIVREMQKK